MAGVSAVGVLILYLIGIGAAFANFDEVLYAEFVRVMHRTGDYFTLTYADAPVHQRPAAPVALYAVVARFVSGEFGLRLVPALLSGATAVFAGAIVWKRTGCISAALTSLFFCAGVLTFFTYGRLVLSDPPFVLATTGALAATMAAQHQARYLLWAAACLGLAFATKSLAAGIPALALTPWLLRAMLRHRGSSELRLGRAVLLFLALAAPFYVIGVVSYGDEFLRTHFGYNLVQRARGDLVGIGIGGPFAYIEHLWKVDGPIIAFLVLGGPLTAAVVALRTKDSDLGIPAILALTELLLLSAMSTRLPHYILPIFPPAAVCLGLLGAEFLRSWRAGRRISRVLMPLIALTVLVSTLGAPLTDAAIVPATESKILGHRAIEAFRNESLGLASDAPIYSLDWYAPAVGYYADHEWKLLTTSDRMAKIVGSVDLFRAPKTVSLVPPWPEGKMLIAAPTDRLEAAQSSTALVVLELIAEEGEYKLVLAEAR